jgi:hypothetical protein
MHQLATHHYRAHHWCANLFTIVQKCYFEPTLKNYLLEYINKNQLVHLLQITNHYLVPLVQR